MNVRKGHMPGFFIVLVTSVLISFGHQINLFKDTNYWLSDHFLRAAISPSTPSHSILVEVDRSNKTKLLQILRQIDQTQASAIVILDSDQHLIDQTNTLGLTTPLIHGVTPELANEILFSPADKVHSPGTSIGIYFGPTFASDSFRKLPLSMAGLPTTGVNRDTNKDLNKPLFPTVLSAILSTLTLPPSIDEDSLINFSLLEENLPRISGDHLIEQNFLPDMLRKKVVFVDEKQTSLSFAIPIPHQTGRNISLMQHTALALESILLGNTIKVANPFLTGALILATALIGVVVFQWLSFRGAGLYSIIIVLLSLILAWLILSLFNFILPVTELIISHLAVGTWVINYIHKEEDEAVSYLERITTTKLAHRLSSKTFAQSDAPWQYIITMVNQVLQLNRSIFLERIDGDHRVTEIAALSCSIDDIDERRRDYHREPYLSAFQAGHAIEPRKPFLTAKADERQFLVPLQFADQLLGFWGFAIKPNHANEHLTEIVNNFASQIAELLYHRIQWRNQEAKKKGAWFNVFRLHLNTLVHHRLRRSYALLENRLILQEAVFNGLNSAAVLFDLFGQIIQTNERLEVLCHDEAFSLYEATALDFLVKLTQLTDEQARTHLQLVVMEKQKFHLPMTFGKSKKNLLLIVSPLDESTQPDIIDPINENPFRLIGVLFEIVDVGHVNNLITLKDNIIDHFNLALRNSLSSLQLAGDLLNQKDLDHAIQIKVHSIIKNKTKECFRAADQLREQMLEAFDIASLDLYPQDSLSILHSTLNSLAKDLDKRTIQVNVNAPKKPELVIAKQEILESLAMACLELLIDDCIDGGLITIELSETKENSRRFAIYRFQSNGVGLMEKQLDTYLYDTDAIVDSGYLKLRLLGDTLKQWGGVLHLTSKLGQGITIELRLRSYIINE